MRISSEVKSAALEAGFHAVGITSAEPFVEAERALRERFERGLLTGSSYGPETIRLHTHPRESLRSARSIISVALSYLSDESDTSDLSDRSDQSDVPSGWMARFFRGLDYHKVLQERLLTLAGAIETKLGRHAEVRSFADTGPLVDRSAAIRAGIGSRGKNTCVYVAPSLGREFNSLPNERGNEGRVGGYSSWVVLGELLTDIELDPDEPAPLDVCGECNECVEACPTRAICEPYVVDVRICLSQVTQSKGFIPYWLREKLGTRVYGCDTCQSACPLNKDAKPGNVDELRPSAGLGESPELLPLLNIGPEEFKARVVPTTAGWIRRTRFRRNVAVALGNVGHPIAVPELSKAIEDPEPMVRGHAAWSLGKIGGRPARVALEKALARETDEHVEDEIRQALDS
jgi:epoxyqueuosine reductase